MIKWEWSRINWYGIKWVEIGCARECMNQILVKKECEKDRKLYSTIHWKKITRKHFTRWVFYFVLSATNVPGADKCACDGFKWPALIFFYFFPIFDSTNVGFSTQVMGRGQWLPDWLNFLFEYIKIQIKNKEKTNKYKKIRN